MSVSFNTPVRIYKYNNSSNNGVIAPDNTGVASASQQSYILNPISAANSGTVVFQTADIGETTATPYTLPAGALISNVRLFQTSSATGLTGGVITVSVVQPSTTGGSNTTTAIGTITPTTTGGVIGISFTATNAVAQVLSNVGPVDATLTFSAANVTAISGGALGGIFDVSYVPRNPNGSITNVGLGYTNS